MNASLTDSLRLAATSTFEQVAFLLAETPPREAQLAEPVRAVASVSFAGAVDGVLEVWVCGRVLPVLAAQMLGAGETPAEPVQRDALGEVANIICGLMLPEIAPGTEFRQGAPTVDAGSDYSLKYAPVPSARVQLGLDAGHADVLLYLFVAGTLARDAA